jgi:hypothetical protein
MSAVVGVVLLALVATVASLVIGLGSMASGGGYDARHSHQWMGLRVLFQAVAVALLFILLVWQGQ